MRWLIFAVLLAGMLSCARADLQGEEQIGDLTMKRSGVPVRLKGDSITTREKFQPPVEITIVAKTESLNLRIGYTAWQVIFNWERNPGELRIDGGPAAGKHRAGYGKIPAHKYVTIRWVVKPTGEKIFVDDELRFENEGDYSKIDNPIEIFSAGPIVSVKSIKVRKLEE